VLFFNLLIFNQILIPDSPFPSSVRSAAKRPDKFRVNGIAQFQRSNDIGICLFKIFLKIVSYRTVGKCLFSNDLFRSFIIPFSYVGPFLAFFLFYG
jgi:hypothetical protein